MSIDSNEAWETWTESYGKRCKESEDSLRDILLQDNSEPSFMKKYMVIGICLVIFIAVIGVTIIFCI